MSSPPPPSEPRTELEAPPTTSRPPVPAASAEAEPAELNLRICATAMLYLRDRHGTAGLAEAASRAGMRVDDLASNRWASTRQIESLLAHVRELVPDEEAFKAACAYEMRTALGPLRAVLWATNPVSVQLIAIRNMELVSRISRYEVVSSSPTHLDIRYVSQRPESRLMCLSRQAQGAALPTLWGLPSGQLREGKCIARGDDACEYRWRFYRPRQLAPTLIGFGLGTVAAVGLAWLDLSPWVGLVAAPLVGSLVGAIVDQRRRLRANLRVGQEIIQDLRDAAVESADARSEIVELQQRERQWTRLLEEQLAEKNKLLQDAVATVQGAAQQRVSVLRGFSHDLRNPLQVLRANVAILRESAAALGEDGARLIDEQSAAAEQLEQLTRMLIAAAATEGTAVVLTPELLSIMPLVDRLRRRIAALAQGKGLRTMVFPTRDAPEIIETDQLVFDRVIDNLFTNAVKYTERGSVAVEIGGTPGHLTIKVSDTGVGIDPEQLERIFQPGGSRKTDRAPGSHGLGLSVVVSLLHQIGGRLEVMSKPQVGTTFWAHFPERLKPPSGRERDEPGKLVGRVVNIRRAAAS